MQVRRQIFRLTTRANHDLTQPFMTWCPSPFILMERTGRHVVRGREAPQYLENTSTLAVIEGYRILPLVNLVVTLQALHSLAPSSQSLAFRGGARGGLEGAIAPLSKHASPPVGMWKTVLSDIFGICNTL